MDELRQNCELLLSLGEQLFDQKTKLEYDKESVENMNEHIERLEDETQRLRDYNKALENELETSKLYIEKMESEANSLEGDRENYLMEAKNAMQSLEVKEKRMQELEFALIEEKAKEEAMERDLRAKVQQLEKSLQSTMDEFNSLQKANEKISSMLMAKQKECSKLTNGTFALTARQEACGV